MGKINLFTLLTMIVVQFVVGYLWFGPYLFGSVVTTASGHSVDFLKVDVLSLLLVVLSSYGLTSIMDTLVSRSGSKDIGGVVKTGLTLGALGIGFPVLMLLSMMGLSNTVLLVIFTYIVLITILSGIVVVKLKKA